MLFCKIIIDLIVQKHRQPVLISDKTSYYKISNPSWSWTREIGCLMFASLWNLAGVSVTVPLVTGRLENPDHTPSRQNVLCDIESPPPPYPPPPPQKKKKKKRRKEPPRCNQLLIMQLTLLINTQYVTYYLQWVCCALFWWNYQCLWIYPYFRWLLHSCMHVIAPVR